MYNLHFNLKHKYTKLNLKFKIKKAMSSNREVELREHRYVFWALVKGEVISRDRFF